MDILFLGDIVGRPGREAVALQLDKVKQTHSFDMILINGENAAAGFGITQSICETLFDLGIDAITLGNHSWDKKEIFGYINRSDKIIRPINYPESTPGQGYQYIQTKNGRVLVINALGRVFMDAVDCPFHKVEKFLKDIAIGRDADAIIVDFHAEATSEKQAFAHYFDGRLSLVVGTHTHAPTADHRILPSGTAYLSDAGMCGNYDSVLGMDKEEPMRRFMTKINHRRYEVAQGEGTLCGVAIRTDSYTGLATHIEPLRQGPHLENCLPKIVGMK